MKRSSILCSVLTVTFLVGAAVDLTTANAAPGDRFQSRSQQTVPAIGGLKAIPVFNCVAGFNKTKHQKDGQGRTTVLECTTPTIICPKSDDFASVIMDKEHANVGGGVQFRYTCKYFDPPK